MPAVTEAMPAVTEAVKQALAARNNGDAWGLYLDKLCFHAAAGRTPSGKEESPKHRALRDVCKVYDHCKPTLEQAADRAVALRQRLVEQYGAENVRVVCLRNTSRLLLHLARANPLENVGLCAERVTGLPMIPGPAVKGVVSTWACWCQNILPDGAFPAEFATHRREFDRAEAKLAADVLGDNDPRGSKCAGQVVFLGAWPVTVPALELDITTPHPEGGNPIPNPFLAIAPGTDWAFVLIARPRNDSDPKVLLDAAKRWLTEALEQAGIGAKTAAGYGHFRLLSEDERKALQGREAEVARKAAEAEYGFKLLTPCLCHGASPDGPAEMRIPSIRGQIRFWHRQMADRANVNRIWGATEGQNVGSSRVSLCLDRHETNSRDQDKALILPHEGSARRSAIPAVRSCQVQTPRKPGFCHKGGARRSAIPAGQTFTLTLRRLPGCTATDWTEAQKAVKLWLLIGGLGLRCNRAAGSVWPTGDWAPKTEAELAQRLSELGCRWAVRLADARLGATKDDRDATPDALRCAASDTVVNPEVFGQALGGRIPSPTRMKVIWLGGKYRLLLTAKEATTLDRARQLLAAKPLGRVQWQPVLPPAARGGRAGNDAVTP